MGLGRPGILIVFIAAVGGSQFTQAQLDEMMEQTSRMIVQTMDRANELFRSEMSFRPIQDEPQGDWLGRFPQYIDEIRVLIKHLFMENIPKFAAHPRLASYMHLINLVRNRLETPATQITEADLSEVYRGLQADIRDGPMFRKFRHLGTVDGQRLNNEAIRQYFIARVSQLETEQFVPLNVAPWENEALVVVREMIRRPAACLKELETEVRTTFPESEITSEFLQMLPRFLHELTSYPLKVFDLLSQQGNNHEEKVKAVGKLLPRAKDAELRIWIFNRFAHLDSFAKQGDKVKMGPKAIRAFYRRLESQLAKKVRPVFISSPPRWQYGSQQAEAKVILRGLIARWSSPKEQVGSSTAAMVALVRKELPGSPLCDSALIALIGSFYKLGQFPANWVRSFTPGASDDALIALAPSRVPGDEHLWRRKLWIWQQYMRPGCVDQREAGMLNFNQQALLTLLEYILAQLGE